MAKPNGIFIPGYGIEDVGCQDTTRLRTELEALVRQDVRYQRGLVDSSKWKRAEAAAAYIAPINDELMARKRAGSR